MKRKEVSPMPWETLFDRLSQCSSAMAAERVGWDTAVLAVILLLITASIVLPIVVAMEDRGQKKQLAISLLVYLGPVAMLISLACGIYLGIMCS